MGAGVDESGGDERGNEVPIMVRGWLPNWPNTVRGDDGCIMGGDKGGSGPFRSSTQGMDDIPFGLIFA